MWVFQEKYIECSHIDKGKGISALSRCPQGGVTLYNLRIYLEEAECRFGVSRKLYNRIYVISNSRSGKGRMSVEKVVVKYDNYTSVLGIHNSVYSKGV